ncbi:MAG: AraC family transcriptional regulator [Bacteroidales bacterium]|nr:AraC family transcriptional regulator [Bacteroidales bacterium]
MTDEELFAFLRDTIVSEKLYLDYRIDRQQLMDRFHISKDRIGAAFAQGSEYRSLIDFLNETRLNYSARLLIHHPEMTIEEIAISSGFNNATTFGRNFKLRYALTPTEFRSQSDKNSATNRH